jgi:VanZ family protein
MPAPRPLLKRWLITTMVAAIIVYGSLYPFAFRVPPHDIGPVATLIASVWVRPGRADALANILLYMPFGFCFLLGASTPRYRLLAVATVTGGLLSLAMELTQYYDAWRVTSFSDVVTNTLGTLLGGVAAIAMGSSIRLPAAGTVSAPPIPVLLIVSWLAYRFYPYVPTANVHKYWNALKPIVLTPSLGGYDLFRQSAIWLTLCALLEVIVQRRRSAYLAPLFAAAVLCAMVITVGVRVRLAEPVGAALGCGVWLLLLLLPERLRTAAAALVLCSYVVALRLEPFTFTAAVGRDFGWVPFRSLMQGSLRVDTLALLEKFFLYGGMVYLLGVALGRRLPAALLVAALRWRPAGRRSGCPSGPPRSPIR